MFNKLKLKIQSINFIKIFKLIILSNIRIILSYNITVFLLGYSVFTPLFVRLFHKNFDTVTVECAPSVGSTYGYNVRDFFSSLFGADTNIYQGFTLGEIILFGTVVGLTMKSVGLVQEYAIPPLMRQVGFKDWYTDRELNNMLHADFRSLRQDVIILRGENNAGFIGLSNHLRRIHDDLTVNINASRDALVVLLTGLHNNLSSITNENINPLYEYCYNISNQVEAMAELLRMQGEQALSPTALRAELDRLVTLYNNEHLNITNSLQSILVNLQEQAAALDASDLNQANEALQSHISFLENVLRQHAEGATRVREVVQNQIDLVDQQIEATQQLVVANSQGNNSSLVSGGGNPITPPTRPNVSIGDVVNGVGSSVLTQRENIVPSTNEPTMDVIPSNNFDLPSLSGNGVGHYILERRGNELIIRLSLNGNIDVPIQEMATNPLTSQLTRSVTGALTNTVTDMVVSGALTAGTSLVRGAFVGGFNGMLGSLGMAPIMRVMNSPSTQRVLNADQIESFAKAANVGDSVGTGLGIAKSFVKNAWWVLKNA